ncbi:polyprenyl diphosphate synthase [Thioalkalivibrio sp.]|uniref:polyprenyl diphosphate synthase n=1 Tax=Thioalkalivibrio sp. TaxID=2093813 RepID=UPI003567E61D
MAPDSVETGRIPAHVAVIMDGNGRWAEARGLPRSAGHRAGLKATRRAVEFFANRGVRALTLFAFSSENWQRPQAEVEALLELFVTAIEEELPELREKGIRLRFIGAREQFPRDLRSRMGEAEAQTAANDTMTLVVALGYGGRWDILQAALRWARQSSGPDPDPEAFEAFLSTAGLPELDLLIRTGGEQRISNFLLWQAAYAELCFLDALWPETGEAELQEALDTYARRQRRFGRTSEPRSAAHA